MENRKNIPLHTEKFSFSIDMWVYFNLSGKNMECLQVWFKATVDLWEMLSNNTARNRASCIL